MAEQPNTYTLAQLSELVGGALTERLVKIAPFCGDYVGWHQAYRTEMADLSAQLAANFGARITNHGDETRVKIAGLSASSTGGLHQAVRNWCGAATRRAAAERSAPALASFGGAAHV